LFILIALLIIWVATFACTTLFLPKIYRLFIPNRDTMIMSGKNGIQNADIDILAAAAHESGDGHSFSFSLPSISSATMAILPTYINALEEHLNAARQRLNILKEQNIEHILTDTRIGNERSPVTLSPLVAPVHAPISAYPVTSSTTTDLHANPSVSHKHVIAPVLTPSSKGRVLSSNRNSNTNLIRPITTSNRISSSYISVSQITPQNPNQ
jgi:hypothetical protein